MAILSRAVALQALVAAVHRRECGRCLGPPRSGQDGCTSGRPPDTHVRAVPRSLGLMCDAETVSALGGTAELAAPNPLETLVGRARLPGAGAASGALRTHTAP